MYLISCLCIFCISITHPFNHLHDTRNFNTPMSTKYVSISQQSAACTWTISLTCLGVRPHMYAVCNVGGEAFKSICARCLVKRGSKLPSRIRQRSAIGLVETPVWQSWWPYATADMETGCAWLEYSSERLIGNLWKQANFSTSIKGSYSDRFSNKTLRLECHAHRFQRFSN
jgi:hypothetical protein